MQNNIILSMGMANSSHPDMPYELVLIQLQLSPEGLNLIRGNPRYITCMANNKAIMPANTDVDSLQLPYGNGQINKNIILDWGNQFRMS